MCLWSCGLLSTVMQVLFGGAEGGSVFGLKDYVVLIRLSCIKKENTLTERIQVCAF